MRSKRIKHLIISLLAFAIFMAFTVCAYAATPEFVCKECGVDLTYESDGEEFDLTHPSGGSCSHAGKSLHNSLTWAQAKSAATQQPAKKIHVCTECGATVTYKETLAGYKVTHPDGSCSHAGENYDSGTAPDWVKESTVTGGTSGTGTNEEGYGAGGFLLDIVFGSQDSGNSSIVGDILNPFKLLAESADKIDDAIQNLVKEPFYYAFQAVAITLTLFYFMTGLITRDLSQNFGKPTLEMITRPFGRLIVVMTFIIFSADVCRFFLWLSQFALSQVIELGTSTTLGSGSMDMTSVIMDSLGWQKTADLSMGKRIVASISNFGVTIEVLIGFILPFIASMFCNVAAIWVVLSRTVNLVIQSVMAPLALSDLYGEQHFKDTRAFGFLKKYFGLCMQSSVIVLAYYVTNLICGEFMTEIMGRANGSLDFLSSVNLGLYVAVLKIVQIGAVIGSAHKAQEVISG